MHLLTKFSLQSFVQFDQRHERKNRDILTNVLHILEDGIPSIDRSFELKKKKKKGKHRFERCSNNDAALPDRRAGKKEWRPIGARVAASGKLKRGRRTSTDFPPRIVSWIKDETFPPLFFAPQKKEKKEEALDTSFTTSSSTDFVILPALDPPAIVA